MIPVLRVGLALFLVALAPRAAAARDLQGPRVIAMGGSLRAAAAGTSALIMNPAGMSLARMYNITAFYQYRASDAANLINAAVVDSVTARLAAGLSYSFARANPVQTVALAGGKLLTLDEVTNTHEVALGLAYPLGSLATIGLTAKYLNHQSTLPSTAPAELAPAGISTVSFDAGAIIKLVQGLQVGVVGYNLVPVDSYNYPRLLGMGASYTFAQLMTVSFDTVLNFNSHPDGVKPSFHGGLEAFFSQRYALRAGAAHDMVRGTTYVTGGLGLLSQRVGAEVGVRQMVKGGAETLLAFSLQLFMQ